MTRWLDYLPAADDAGSLMDDAEFWRAYFAKKAYNGPELKPLGAPCHDCAVTCGFYTPYSDELAKQSRETQMAASLRWHCHNYPTRACRGNLEHLGLADEVARPAGQPSTEGMG